MKMNKFLAIALAAAVGFSACSKDEGGKVDNGDNQSLTIFIGQEDDNTTRSIDVGLGDDTKTQQLVTFSNGELFLCDATGRIEHVYTFGTTTNLDTGVLGINAATTGTGVTITGVKGSVTQAFIVGNSSAITGTAATAYTDAKVVGKNISLVKAVATTPVMQYSSANKDLSGVTLYGESSAFENDPLENGGADDDKKYVAITLYPQVARIEIADITAIPTTATVEYPTVVNITKYNVEGIYINNFYPSITFGGTAGTLVNPGQGGATVYGNNVGSYTTGAGVLHDYSATYFGNDDTDLTKYPNGTSNAKVWAYNLPASKTASTTVAPHIIVAINGVIADDGNDYSAMKFITANKLFKASDGTTEITHFEAGKIYQIEPGDFQFSVKNIHTEAEIGTIQLRVKVSIIGWTTESMKPGLQ